MKFNGSQTIEFLGKVTRVSPTASTTVASTGTSTTIPVEIEVVEPVEELKPGLTIDVRVITNDVKDVVTVPILATMEDSEDETYVFIVREDFTLEKRYVKPGVADNQVIQIDGVTEGEIVVTNPTEALEEGMSVQYLPLLEE